MGTRADKALNRAGESGQIFDRGVFKSSEPLSQCPEPDPKRNPITPSTIKAIENNRKALRGSPRKKIPNNAVPTAPIPTQTA